MIMHQMQVYGSRHATCKRRICRSSGIERKKLIRSAAYIYICAFEYKRYRMAQNNRYKEGAKDQVIYNESGELT